MIRNVQNFKKTAVLKQPVSYKPEHECFCNPILHTISMKAFNGGVSP